MGSTHRISGSMEDGRFGTSYQSSCVLNSKLHKDFNVPSYNNTDYREKLQTDGLKALNAMTQAQPCGPYACADLGMAFTGPPKEAPAALEDIMPYVPHSSGAPLQSQ